MTGYFGKVQYKADSVGKGLKTSDGVRLSQSACVYGLATEAWITLMTLLQGWRGSYSAKTWHTFSMPASTPFATKPNILPRQWNDTRRNQNLQLKVKQITLEKNSWLLNPIASWSKTDSLSLPPSQRLSPNTNPKRHYLAPRERDSTINDRSTEWFTLPLNMKHHSDIESN